MELRKLQIFFYSVSLQCQYRDVSVNLEVQTALVTGNILYALRFLNIEVSISPRWAEAI